MRRIRRFEISAAPPRLPDRVRRVAGWMSDWRLWGSRAAVSATVTWLVAAPLGLGLARALDLDPLTVGGAVFPVGVGAVLLAGCIALAAFRRTESVTGLYAGVYAGWLAFVVAAAIQGAPYGFGRLSGDLGRLVAFATRLETTWQSVDQIVPTVPSEYPPLYPWLLARAAVLADIPAWNLFKYSEPLLFSAAVLIGFLLWRRLVPAWAALLVAGFGPLLLPNPGKDFELAALVVFLPWALASFAHDAPAGMRLPWYIAGAIGGLTVLTYQGYLLFGALGLVALLSRGLLEPARRRPYLAHVARVAGLSFLLASWYVVPYVTRMLTAGGQRVSDSFLSAGIATDPVVLPFLEPTPLGVLQLVGLLGATAYAGRRWWAVPVLLLLAGTYAYQAYHLLQLATTGQTGFLHYANPLVGALLLGAGALTLAELAPAFAARARSAVGPRPEWIAVAAMAAALAWAGLASWDALMPAPHGLRDGVAVSGKLNLAAYAHAEPLSDGSPPPRAPSGRRLAAASRAGFPADQVAAEIQRRLGADASPVVLSYDQRLFTFHPLPGYVSPNRGSANSLQRWDDRAEAVRELASISDPVAFASAARRTPFGAVDVFVLREEAGAFRWHEVRFNPAAFAPPYFDLVRDLPNRTVVAIRRA
jgi:hypothetical protein